VVGRLDDPDVLADQVSGCDVVVHCAAVYAYDRRADELDEVNVRLTDVVVEAAARAGARRVVVVSSSVTRGSSATPVPRDETGTIGSEPAPAYFRSKVAQERAALDAGAARGIEVVLALPTVVLGGPDGRLGPSNRILVRYLLDPTRTTYPGGCNVVSAHDVADGLLLLAERGTPGERYLLGGDDVSWRTLHATVSDLVGLPGPYLEAGPAQVRLAARLSQAWARVSSTRPLTTTDEALTVGRWYWYRHERATALGYAPRSARQATAEALGWLTTSPHLPRFVRESLRLAPEVLAARELVPRPLDGDGSRRARAAAPRRAVRRAQAGSTSTRRSSSSSAPTTETAPE